MAINVRQTFDPTGTVYPNYLQQQYLKRQILSAAPADSGGATAAPPAQSAAVPNRTGNLTGPVGGSYEGLSGFDAATGKPRLYAGDPDAARLQREHPGMYAVTSAADAKPYEDQLRAEGNQGAGTGPAGAATADAQQRLIAGGASPKFYSGGTAIFGDGGIIPEPVVGRGLYSGKPYIFGEKGPEGVIPNDQMPEHMQEHGGHGSYAQGGTIGYRSQQNGPNQAPVQGRPLGGPGPNQITPMVNPNPAPASRYGRAFRGRNPREQYDPYFNRQFLDEGRAAMHNPVQFSVNGRNYTTFTDANGERHVRDEASGHTVPLGVISSMGIQDGGVSDGGVVADSSVIGDSTVADSGGPTVNDLMSGFNSPSQFDQQNPQPATAPAPTPTYTAPTPTVAPTTTTSGTTDTSGGNTLTAGTTDTTTSTPPPDTTTTTGIMDPTPVSATDVTVGGATGGGNLAYPYDPFAAALINNQDSSGGTTLNPDDLQNLLSQ